MDKQTVAPYVRALNLEDLNTRIQISDEALMFLKSLQHVHASPGACVALALYRHDLDTKERVTALAKLSGKTLDAFMKSVSENRAELRLPFPISFEELAESAHLPVGLAGTAKQVFLDIKSELPEDSAAICASVMLACATKRGFNRDLTLSALARISSTDPDQLLETEAIVQKTIDRHYRPKKPEEELPEHVKEIRKVSSEVMAELKADQKKKVQQKLNFRLIPRREKD